MSKEFNELSRVAKQLVVSRFRAQGGNTSDNITQAAANKAAEEGGLHDAAIAAAEEWANAEWMHAKSLGAGGPGYADRCNKAEIACRKAISELAADRASRQVANKAEVEPVAPTFNYLLRDRLVSVDVSTCDEDAAHRIFAELTGDTASDGTTLIAIETSRNFATPPATTGASTAPRPTDDELLDATLRDRDAYQEWADKLADAIAKHFGVDIGEHSNQNLPWAEALEAIENAEPVGASTVLTDKRIAEIASANSDVPSFARAIERETLIGMLMANDSKIDPVAAQAGQVAVPIYQVQQMTEQGSSAWHDASEDAYQTFMPERRRIVHAAPSPAKESK